MSATLRVAKDHVQVEVIGALDFRVWSVMRDARETALAAKLPLRVDMRNCSHGDMGGIGSMLGALLAGPLTRRLGVGPTLVGALLVSALGSAQIWLAGAASPALALP